MIGKIKIIDLKFIKGTTKFNDKQAPGYQYQITFNFFAYLLKQKLYKELNFKNLY